MYTPTAKSYFSGAGGLDQGLLQAGINVTQSLEYDADCCDTLRANFTHKVICKDIRDITVGSQDRSDIITGTYPCTKYSAIADIHGTRTGDDLFLHFFRHIAIESPEVYVVENVPGMRKFPVVMEAMTKLPNYYLNIFCPLDANNWLPQNRKRLILIGSKKPFHISPPVARKRLTLKDIVEKDVQTTLPDYILSRIAGKYRDKPIISDPDKGDIAPTCVAHYSKDLGTRMIVDRSQPHGVRPYTVKEYAALQGFPAGFKFCGGERQAYKQIGNAVAVDMGEWVGTEVKKYFN